MGALPIRLLYLYTFAIVFVASACGFAAFVLAPGLHVSPLGAAFFVSTTALVVLTFFATRWWIRVLRAAGVPLLVSSQRDTMTDAALLTALMLGGAALAFFLYGATGNRLTEAGLSLVLIAPATFFVTRASYAHMKPPVPQETQLLRTSAIMLAILAVISLVNIFIQMHARAAGLVALRDAAIALYFVVIPTLSIRSYFIWQRFKLARGTEASIAP